RRAVPMLGAAVVALVAAKGMGGFFTTAPGLRRLGFALHPGFADTARDTLGWNARTFGVLPNLDVAGLFARCRGRLLFGLLTAGSLVVVNSVRFSGSDDIIKFAALAQLAMGVLGSAAIASVYRPAPARAALAASLAIAASAEGCLFL